MQKIIPHLWFDKEAKEAAEFYVSVFGGQSQITNVNTLRIPSGDTEVVSFELNGYAIEALSAGSYFKLNPSISFIVHCHSVEEINGLWDRLIDGGSALMPLDSYDFSERFGWVKDRYGLSWQLILTDQAISEKIIPSLMFIGEQYGKAEEAIHFYQSIFNNSSIDFISRYGKGEGNQEGTIKQAIFRLEGQPIHITENSYHYQFGFNEAFSLMVYCDTQAEIDYYWEKLSAVPEAEACGWLKDKYGVSWQIIPTQMAEMMRIKDREKLDRYTQTFLKMKKLDLAELEKAAQG